METAPSPASIFLLVVKSAYQHFAFSFRFQAFLWPRIGDLPRMVAGIK